MHKQHKRQNAVGKLANPGAGAGEGAALALRALTAAQLERMDHLGVLVGSYQDESRLAKSVRMSVTASDVMVR